MPKHALEYLAQEAIPLFDLRPSLRPDPAMQTRRRADRRSRLRKRRAPGGLALTGGSTAAGYFTSGPGLMRLQLASEVDNLVQLLSRFYAALDVHGAVCRVMLSPLLELCCQDAITERRS